MMVAYVSPLPGQAPKSMHSTMTVAPDGFTTSMTMNGSSRIYHPSRILVRFRNKARSVLPGSTMAGSLGNDPNLLLVNNPPGLSAKEAVQRYRANPNVLYAEPDFEVRTTVTIPNDTLWAQQWDMTMISAPTAWDTQKDASDVVVAVIDTGIDFAHPDLLANVDVSHSFSCINGPCVPGGADDAGHGTHVAGTIGATANNSAGIAGINWSVRMISLKFLDSGGRGYTSDAVAAFNKIAELKNGGLNIRVTNNSWSGSGYSQALKDAMEAVESLGIVNVCAAGNSYESIDTHPEYPAAYNNRGIISVMATDSQDQSASFSDYGLASVDIAAPGVNTLSTVPTGSCDLCDPSGYRLLSGTSMATPHVTGVMAALMHRNPLLTAAQARDVVLDPGSYDSMTSTMAKRTSTGGRLNFAKALASVRLSTPEPLNGFPSITTGPDFFVSSGNGVSLSENATDPDPGDVTGLRTLWEKSVPTPGWSGWLLSSMESYIFPDVIGSSLSFSAPSLARAALVSYDVSVADNRGGSAHGRQLVTVYPASNPGSPPTGTLSLSATSAPVGSTITVNFPVTDPEGTNTRWELTAMGLRSGMSTCCMSGPSRSIQFSQAGVYRISALAIDQELNLSARSSIVLSIGGTAGTPPVADAKLDKLSGTVPFSVNVDMSSSYDPDGSISYYYIDCGTGSAQGTTSAKRTCTFTEPGTYWLPLIVMDNSGLEDQFSAYVVALPSAPGNTKKRRGQLVSD
jgi:subtilisin family serine protease